MHPISIPSVLGASAIGLYSTCMGMVLFETVEMRNNETAQTTDPEVGCNDYSCMHDLPPCSRPMLHLSGAVGYARNIIDGLGTVWWMIDTSVREWFRCLFILRSLDSPGTTAECFIMSQDTWRITMINASIPLL